MKKILTFIVLAVMSFSAFCGQDWKPIRCPGLYRNHIQGFAIADGKIFWSFTTYMIRTDAEGNMEKIIEAPYHHGDCCVHEGKLYVAVNTGAFDQKSGANNSVWIYDTDLNFIKTIKIAEHEGGLGGIEFWNGSFYTVGGVHKSLPTYKICKWSKDFKLEKVFNIPVRDTLMGAQTICRAYGRFWLGVYGAEGADRTLGFHECDDEFNLIKKHQVKGACFGIAAIKGKNGENFMIADSLWSNDILGYARLWATARPEKIPVTKK